jgi:hypothetical protein
MSTHAAPFRSAHNFALITMFLLGMGVLVAAATLVTDAALTAMLLGGDPSGPTQRLTEEAEGITEVGLVEIMGGLAALVSVPTFIATVVTFGMWIYRSHSNLRALGGTNQEFTPGSAVGWYFVPIANLIKPYHAMKELWHQSAPPPRDAFGLGSFAAGPPALFAWWWGLWLLSNFAGRLQWQLAKSSTTDADLLFESEFGIVADLLAIGLGVAAILVVRTVDRRQQETYERIQQEAPPPYGYATAVGTGHLG